MPGRLANEATAVYVGAIERAIAGFAPNERLLRLPYDRDLKSFGLTPPAGDPIPLLGLDGSVVLHLSLSLRYRLVEAPADATASVHTVAYSYQLELPDDPLVELLRFDWHPYVPDTQYPHVHVGQRLVEGGSAISERSHIPTGGYVTLFDVLMQAQRDFGVRPVRADWHARLAAAHRVLETSLAWSDPRSLPPAPPA